MKSIPLKIISLFLVVAMMSSFSSCVTKKEVKVIIPDELKNFSTSGTLIVNGEVIDHNGLLFYDTENEFFVIPFFTIIRSLGGTVKWYTENHVFINLNDNSYILNTGKNTLVKLGKGFFSGDIIFVPPGSQNGAQYNVIGEEFVLNVSCARWFFSLNGVEFNCDRENIVITFNN